MINGLREVQSALRVLIRKCPHLMEGAGKTSSLKKHIRLSANECTVNDVFTQVPKGFWKE